MKGKEGIPFYMYEQSNFLYTVDEYRNREKLK